MSPRELKIFADAFRARMVDEARIKRAEAYQLASLIRTAVWEKRMPSYETIFPDDHERKEMTDEEMLEQARALNRAFGGSEVIIYASS